MAAPPLVSLERALLFRITHIRNLPWLLRNGLHAASGRRDPDFTPIGNPELIGKRQRRVIPISPGGTLDDYVPFYFTPHSPMLLNILSGRGGLPARSREEIAFVISSVAQLQDCKVGCVLTDAHAYSGEAQFFPCPEGLGRIDWELLRSRDFKRDPDDPGKLARYQAEALVHTHVPVDALLGFAGPTDSAVQQIRSLADGAGVTLPVAKRPGWYFR